MSFSDPIGAASLPASTLPTIDQAYEPAAVRKGGATAKSAYDTGLAFEQMLMNELTQELSNTVSTDGSDSSDGTDSSSSSDSGGLMGGSDPASSMYSSMLPQTLTTSMMSGGNNALAMQIAQSIDPSLAGQS